MTERQKLIVIKIFAVGISAAFLFLFIIAVSFHFHDDDDHSDCPLCQFLLTQCENISAPCNGLVFYCDQNKPAFNREIRIQHQLIYLTGLPNAPPAS